MIAYAAEAASEVAETAAETSTISNVIDFLFNTYAGMGVLVGVGLVVSLLLGFFLEMRTRRVYKDRGPAASGESFFDDDDDEDSDDD